MPDTVQSRLCHNIHRQATSPAQLNMRSPEKSSALPLSLTADAFQLFPFPLIALAVELQSVRQMHR